MQVPSLTVVQAKIENFTNIFFILVHCISSNDFGFLKCSRKRNKFAANCITVVQCLFVCTYNVYNSLESYSELLMNITLKNVFAILLTIVVSIQYVLNSLVLVLNNRNTSFYEFQISLRKIDSQLSTDSSSYYIEIKIISSIVLCLVYKAFMNTVFCSTNREECVTTLSPYGPLFTIPQLWTHDILMLVYFFVFYSVYRRLKVLNRLVYIDHGEQVLETLNIYINIADILQKVKKYFDLLYLLALLMTTPDLIFLTYIGLLKSKNLGSEEYTLSGFVSRIFYNVQNFITTSLPAVAAGLVTAAVEDLKLILLDRLLRERDKEHEIHLQMFVDYVASHPLRFTLFEVVSLDWSLPVLIVNVCITYQIIIVQFTQLY